MKVYQVTLIERTQHRVQVLAANADEAAQQAMDDWKAGYLCDDNPVLLDLTPSSVERN